MTENKPINIEEKEKNELYTKVLNLKDLVAYQDGTVASRMLVNKQAGTITIFSFDKDEGLSEHTAPYNALVTILDGEAEIWIGGQTFRVKQGESIILPANIPHALSAVARFKMMLTMIRQ